MGLSPGRGRGAGEQQILQRQDLQASTSVPRQLPQAQHRREQTQRSASSVCASSFTKYRPCAQACVIHFCSHPPTRLLQQRRRSAAARRFFAAAALGGLWRRRWLSSRSPSPAPSSHAHASAVRAGAELSGGEGALPAAAGRGTCASPCPPSPARQQQWCSGRGMLNAPTPKHQRRWPR